MLNLLIGLSSNFQISIGILVLMRPYLLFFICQDMLRNRSSLNLPNTERLHVLPGDMGRGGYLLSAYAKYLMTIISF